jgi:hypothetical protein
LAKKAFENGALHVKTTIFECFHFIFILYFRAEVEKDPSLFGLVEMVVVNTIPVHVMVILLQFILYIKTI